MKFVSWMPARVDWGPVVRKAESLGFDYVCQADSQMVYADTMVSLATCAMATTGIRLGTGVTNPLTRSVAVMASSMASLNVLAPGRVFLGLGTGYTAMETMGMPSASVAQVAEFIRQFRALTTGQAVEVTIGSRTREVRLLNRPGESLDDTFVNLRDRIPVYVAAHGPRMLEMAGELGDGLILGVVRPTASYMERTRAALQRGADRAGRTLDDFPIHLMANIYVMGEGETFGSEDMKRAVMGLEQSNIGTYSVGRKPIPGAVERILEREIPEIYRDLVRENRAATGERQDQPWYVQAYDGHGWRLRPELLPYVSGDMLRGRALIGTPDEIIAKVKEWEALGISAVGPLAQDSVQLAEKQIERFGNEVIGRY